MLVVYFGCWQPGWGGGEGEWTPVQRLTTPAPDNQGAKEIL